MFLFVDNNVGFFFLDDTPGTIYSYICINEGWKQISNVFVCIGEEWKLGDLYVCQGEDWKTTS